VRVQAQIQIENESHVTVQEKQCDQADVNAKMTGIEVDALVVEDAAGNKYGLNLSTSNNVLITCFSIS
jgi:hypothetical protein